MIFLENWFEPFDYWLFNMVEHTGISGGYYYFWLGIIYCLCILFLTPVLHRNAPVLKMATVAFVITVVVGALAFFFLCTALDGFTVNSFWIALFVSFVASLLTFTTEIKFA